MENKNKYCTKCGEKIIPKIGNKKDFVSSAYWEFLDKFDQFTGEVIDYSGLYYRCPNKKWWKLDHDDYFIRKI